jgi:hypothetical protein
MKTRLLQFAVLLGWAASPAMAAVVAAPAPMLGAGPLLAAAALGGLKLARRRRFKK